MNEYLLLFSVVESFGWRDQVLRERVWLTELRPEPAPGCWSEGDAGGVVTGGLCQKEPPGTPSAFSVSGQSVFDYWTYWRKWNSQKEVGCCCSWGMDGSTSERESSSEGTFLIWPHVTHPFHFHGYTLRLLQYKKMTVPVFPLILNHPCNTGQSG